MQQVVSMEASPRRARESLLWSEEGGMLSVLHLQEQSQVEPEVAHKEDPPGCMRIDCFVMTFTPKVFAAARKPASEPSKSEPPVSETRFRNVKYITSFTSNPTSHLNWKPSFNQMEQIGGRYKCWNCSKSYRLKHHLVQHVRDFCGQECCPYCGYRTNRKWNLKTHIRRIHTNEWLLQERSLQEHPLQERRYQKHQN
ncbi:PREDICTED: uncharacterized protein LOC106744502 isoform X3 [Dinoponera quadriceps]|uniref:Uncharacterized protein LOC106744502 isoform X3 n=1 Tax=Dinoponera quadriceps TaxID=609295 RepID=A0A6P3X9D2_DINQU|nr:PREDICTED: uncharacterized protein LOC106744502 isoform X3 [Dinoponera quadriceps]